MPIPTSKKGGGSDVDISQLSAFAVYNNLVPGVKMYEDTSESTPASQKKRNKKNKKKLALKEELEMKNGVGEHKKDKQQTATADAAQNGKKQKPGKVDTNSKKQNGQQKTPSTSETNNTNPKKKKQSTTTQESTTKQTKRITPTTLASSSADDTLVAENPENGTSSTKSKKKKNKKNKKKQQIVEDENDVPSNIEPAAKLRKLNDASKKQDSNNSKILSNPKSTNKKEKKVETAPQVDKNVKKQKEASTNLQNLPEESVKNSKKSKTKKAKTDSNELATEAPLPQKLGSRGKSSISEQVEDERNFPKKKAQKRSHGELIAIKDSTPAQEQESSAPPDLNEVLNSKVVQDSVEHGKQLFKWLVHPQSTKDFMTKYWEKTPFIIKRGELFPDYYEWMLSSSKLDTIFRKNVLKYSENVDVTSYENGIRETISKDMQGRARPAVIWDYYNTGHSIRILNPQTYCAPLRRLNASLQEMFGCFVGANVYLTPPESQGFAPHYDDIEAFILQVEGKKHWKLYKPRTPNEELPRFSSHDFGKEEETLGEPYMDIVLEAGDLLYFPRGIIHQAKTVDGFHSMHITLSCYQQNSWVDLLKHHFNQALDKLAVEDVNFRKGLPIDYLSYMGIANAGNPDKTVKKKRQEFKKTLKSLVDKVGGVAGDFAADAMGKKFIWDSLPPYLTRKEKDRTVEEDGEFLNNGKVKNRVELDPDVRVKLIRKNCVRLVSEENVFRLYFSIENSLVYHQEEPQYLEIPEEITSTIACLINTYPDYMKIEELPMEDDDVAKKIQIVTDLWERGILMTEKPLEAGEIDDEDFDFDDIDLESYDEEGSADEEDFDDEEDSDDDDGFFVGDDEDMYEIDTDEGGSDEFDSDEVEERSVDENAPRTLIYNVDEDEDSDD